MRSLGVIVLLVASLIACSNKSASGPSCDKVVDNMLAVTKTQLTGHGDMELGNRKVMIEQCEARKMPADQRTCLVTAKDLTAIAACTPKK